MITFKQFLENTDPLTHTLVQMWVKQHFVKHHDGITKFIMADDYQDVLDADSDLYDYLVYEYFGDTIPLNVAKGDSGLSAADWVHHQVRQMLNADDIHV